MLATLAAEPLGSDVGSGTLLHVDGELDLSSAGLLRTAIGDLLGQGVRHVEVDLDRCSFIDSSGMGALLWAARRLHAAGGDLVAVRAHGATMRALEISGVGRALASDN